MITILTAFVFIRFDAPLVWWFLWILVTGVQIYREMYK